MIFTFLLKNIHFISWVKDNQQNTTSFLENFVRLSHISDSRSSSTSSPQLRIKCQDSQCDALLMSSSFFLQPVSCNTNASSAQQLPAMIYSRPALFCVVNDGVISSELWGTKQCFIYILPEFKALEGEVPQIHLHKARHKDHHVHALLAQDYNCTWIVQKPQQCIYSNSLWDRWFWIQALV